MLLLGCGGTGSFGAVQTRLPTPGATPLTLMTFNVHRDESGDRGTVEAVGAPNADIVCLQEPTAAWERVLRRRYATQYPYMVFKTDESAGGLAVLSRFPLQDRGVVTISDWHPALYVLVDTPAGRLQILNLHLRATFDGDHDVVSNFFDMDEDHMREVELFTQKLLPHVPAIVIGDFNEDPRGPALRWFEARGFRNALSELHPGQATWQGRSVLASFRMSLDHVLYTEPLVLVDANVAPPGRSDHLPVLARFEVVHVWRQDHL
jgi:endonuclease/exonuclease/phosphatase (EEP) superfamily protein YafD